MPEVRSNVDEIIATGNTPAVEPEKDEVESAAQPSEEVKSNDESPYEEPEAESKKEASDVKDKDEFGNEVIPQKTYTEEEVNRMMRERFKRSSEGRQQEQVQRQDQSHEGDDNWEAQLEGFVEKTVQKLSAKQLENQRLEREKNMQAEFEEKFTTGMTRYRDFKDVVSSVPISNEMLLATRSMKDPAAFIYAASKTQAKELERISKIQDPYFQVAEMGRLEERMRKVRSGTSSPKPVSQVQGDIANRENVRQSVDELIRKDQLRKFQRRY